MGISDLFTSKANLTGMINSGTPHVDQVAHKTRIEVNEKGSIAAAATGAMVVPLMGGTTARMTIDHPFIFLIRENDSGAILFAGRVQQPDQSTIIDDSLSKFQLNRENQNYNSQPAYQGATGSSQNFNSQPNYQGSAASNQNFNQQPAHQNQKTPIVRTPESYNNQRYPTSDSGSSGAFNNNKFTTEQPNRNVPYNTNSQPWQSQQKYGKEYESGNVIASQNQQHQNVQHTYDIIDKPQIITNYPYINQNIQPSSSYYSSPLSSSIPYSSNNQNVGYNLQTYREPARPVNSHVSYALASDRQFQHPIPADNDGITFTL